jgi:hypothetical protein
MNQNMVIIAATRAAVAATTAAAVTAVGVETAVAAETAVDDHNNCSSTRVPGCNLYHDVPSSVGEELPIVHWWTALNPCSRGDWNPTENSGPDKLILFS